MSTCACDPGHTSNTSSPWIAFRVFPTHFLGSQSGAPPRAPLPAHLPVAGSSLVGLGGTGGTGPGRYTAKIADFGLSVKMDANQSHVSNLVQV